ncbi:MAG TPA: hypothetical protein VJ809_18275 [Pirellulales bacterium]|nr:hypothetical protein [Pirellulales bacterium]
MADNEAKPQRIADADLEREIRDGRKFTLAEAIGRLAGPGAMKGASPIARKKQAEAIIDAGLECQLTDAAGALREVLLRRICESELLDNHLDQPLAALAAYVQRALDSPYVLAELVREADIEWGRVFDVRPYFQKEGCPAHEDDPYTIETVQACLAKLLDNLAAGEGPGDSIW